MERIFYPAEVVDPVTKLPIYIFDTSFLPSTEVINYEEFVPTMTGFLPTHPYVLIMFSCGLNKISWIWGIKFLKTFLADSLNLSNLWKVISVHDSWFIKSFAQMLSNFQSTKNNFAQLNRLLDSFTLSTFGELISKKDLEEKEKKSDTERKSIIIHCSTLSELSNYVDVTKLKISLNVYKHNGLLEPEIHLAMRIKPLINPYTKLDAKLDPVFYHHFYQIFRIVDLHADKVELVFHKPGNKPNTDIFFQCVNRNQLIWINDWDLYCISTAFKRILMDLPRALIPTNLIQLPIKDDLEYTSTTFHKVMNDHDINSSAGCYSQLLLQLCTLCQKITNEHQVTRHNSISLSKCLSHCLSHESFSSQNKDSILIVNRFFKNVLDHWDNIKSNFPDQFATVDEFLRETASDSKYELDYELPLPVPHVADGDEGEEAEESVSLAQSISRNIKHPSFSTPVSSPNQENRPMTPRSVQSHKYSSPLTHRASSSSMFSTISTSSAVTFVSSVSSAHSTKKEKKLQDLSNLGPAKNSKEAVAPPSPKKLHSRSKSLPPQIALNCPVPLKKPVIRGRKVGELAKLFEERTEGIGLLSGM